MTKRPRTEESTIAGSVVVNALTHLPGYVSDTEYPEFLCTHNGQFHCDEALALAMLKLLPEFKDTPILRTRDNELIKKSKLVVDVGSIYDAPTNRFDHHMKEFTTTFGEDWQVTKLSSAGLVYKHYGERILAEIAGDTVSEDGLKQIYLKVYRNFIQEVDAVDNGVEAAENMKYRITSGLGSRVRRCNPGWQDENTKEIENAAFVKAMSICQTEFLEQACGLLTSWWPARKIVEEAVATTQAEGKVMVLPTFCPWQEHLADIEDEKAGVLEDKEAIQAFRKTLYVIFQDSRSKTYRIQAVSAVRGSFHNRKPLPEPWRGVRDADLSKVVGIEGCTFCHASGFIGGNATLEGAIAMATAAVAF